LNSAILQKKKLELDILLEQLQGVEQKLKNLLKTKADLEVGIERARKSIQNLEKIEQESGESNDSVRTTQ